MFLDRDQAFSSMMITALMMHWYPNVYDLAIVVQEVQTPDSNRDTTVLRLIGIGSLKDKVPVTEH